MCKPSGEWVIIISNSREKSARSIRVILFFSLVFIGFISVIALSVIFITSTNQSYTTEKRKELYRQGNTIAISLVTTGYFDPERDKSYLATIQASVPGRALVINSYGVILYDSNHLDVGKSYATKQVADGLKGKSSYYFIEETNQGMVTIPIVDRDFNTVVGVVVISDSFNDIDASISQLMNLTLIFAVILIAVDSILSYYISSIFTRPFKKLLDHIEQFSDGFRSEPIDVKGNKEIEEIATSFNEMIIELEAIESNRKQFVANVSHELKTPLSSVKVLAESLLHQPNAPIEIYQEFLNDINHEVDRETKIINDLLTLVTLDKEDNPLILSEVVVNLLIENVIKRLRPLADVKNVNIYFESYQVIIAELDETKMELVMTNLIENAIKYNVFEGVVNVTLDTDDKNLIISVRDTGDGISEENIAKIFKRFYRVDKTRSRATGGTGLGLSIVKRTIGMHNGTIKCMSEVGEWTEFVITLPLKQKKVDLIERNLDQDE